MQQRSPERWRSPSRKRAAPKPPHSRVIIASLSPTGYEQRRLAVPGRPDDPPHAALPLDGEHPVADLLTRPGIETEAAVERAAPQPGGNGDHVGRLGRCGVAHAAR